MRKLKKGDLVIFTGKWSRLHSIKAKKQYGTIGVVFSIPDNEYQTFFSIIDVYISSHQSKNYSIENYYFGDLDLLEYENEI